MGTWCHSFWTCTLPCQTTIMCYPMHTYPKLLFGDNFIISCYPWEIVYHPSSKYLWLSADQLHCWQSSLARSVSWARLFRLSLGRGCTGRQVGWRWSFTQPFDLHVPGTISNQISHLETVVRYFGECVFSWCWISVFYLLFWLHSFRHQLACTGLACPPPILGGAISKMAFWGLWGKPHKSRDPGEQLRLIKKWPDERIKCHMVNTCSYMIYALICQEIQTFHILKLYLISVCYLLGPLNYPASSHIPSCSVNPRHSHGFWGSSWRCLSCGATSGPLSSACWKMRVVHPSCLGCVPCWDEPIRSGFIVCNVLKRWWSILCVLCGIYPVFRAKPIHT